MRRIFKNRGVRLASIVVAVCVAGVLVYVFGVMEAVQTPETTTMKLLTVRP